MKAANPGPALLHHQHLCECRIAGKTELAPPDKPTLMIVTGEKGAGKTTWCRCLVEAARSEGLDVRGLLSPARFEDGRKTGILVRDLTTGEERLLAEARCTDFDGATKSKGTDWSRSRGARPSMMDQRMNLKLSLEGGAPRRRDGVVSGTSISECRWCFDEQTLAWGNACLQAATTCHTLIVDEIGPMELQQGRGWTSIWDVLVHGQFQRVVLVVRPSLVEAAQRRLREVFQREANVLDVGGAADDEAIWRNTL